MGVVLLVILKTSHLLGTQMGYLFLNHPNFQCGPFIVSLMKLNSLITYKNSEYICWTLVWYSKPSIVTFLKPLGDTLSKLEDNGVVVQPVGMTSEPFVCKVLTIAGTCDLPAKALVLNSV